jgi:hypothetical protein
MRQAIDGIEGKKGEQKRRSTIYSSYPDTRVKCTQEWNKEGGGPAPFFV